MWPLAGPLTSWRSPGTIAFIDPQLQQSLTQLDKPRSSGSHKPQMSKMKPRLRRNAAVHAGDERKTAQIRT